MDERRKIVEDALDRFLPEPGGQYSRLTQAMRYSVFSGGKRLRPILAIAAFEVVGGEGNTVLAPACATELIHTYSLIHDDLPAMDDDDLRRGRPTCHKEFDEALAILAGDALLTLAFEIVTEKSVLPPECAAAVVRELAGANGYSGMLGGQAADIAMEGEPPDIGAIEYIHGHKTGAPLAAAVRIGAIAAGAESIDLERLTAYGERIGLAFQIADDLLDETGTAEEMGKAVGKDRDRGKMTYPVVVGAESAVIRAQDLVDDAIRSLDAYGERVWALAGIAQFMVDRRN
jgi:geranylgeranyl diphosphate synthase type II